MNERIVYYWNEPNAYFCQTAKESLSAKSVDSESSYFRLIWFEVKNKIKIQPNRAPTCAYRGGEGVHGQSISTLREHLIILFIELNVRTVSMWIPLSLSSESSFSIRGQSGSVSAAAAA
jgi:hypothetical protein